MKIAVILIAMSCMAYYADAAPCTHAYSGRHQVLDSGGPPFQVYMEYDAETGAYKNFFMNGTVAQEGICHNEQLSDGGCAAYCSATGPGIPPNMVVSMRSYYDAAATSWDYCYNFDTAKKLPANCDGDGSKGNFLAFGMQKIDPKAILDKKASSLKEKKTTIKAGSEYCNYSGKRHALDAGGDPVDWFTTWNNETNTYINHYMNGTEFQTGSCTVSDESDGACIWVCTAVGTGMPSGYVLSLRSYFNSQYGAFDYCYNYGPKEDMPSSCDPSKGKYMSYGIQKLV